MPPIPSTLDATTISLVESLQRRQKDLSEFQLSRLRSCTGPLAVQQRFAAELREDLEAFARQVENLDAAVDDQRTERDRRELRRIVEEFQGVLTSLKKDARAALLTSKRALDSQLLSHREELLRSSAVREKQDLNEKVTEDALMKANNDVTQTLQRTITLMQGELERSVLSSQLLDTSSAALRSTSSTHDVLDGLLSTSKHLITALEKSDWMDRMLIFAGLAFFVLVVLFILKQRLIDRSIRIAFWWTRFIPNFSGDAALMRMEEGKDVARSVVETASAFAATASAVAASIIASQSFAPDKSVASPTDAAYDTISEVLETVAPQPTASPIDTSTTNAHDEL
ncbi:uncharacterized protein FIBRA_07088 [Fibroporia radiculosa]|uniref:Sec20 C-terminal domain-containing protein n=1 Tax=Fibroporia radiculosa TaxID=599839 RepID=J4I055_9APHY|nr:uncharacterized protein FIBRA_07088 [Fibroporia radiculosa]CCM04892.1 predicted protein [Fibroporia radiculosa]